MKARKGFTLVELLIVIAIIGILAGAMLLSGGSLTDSAEASNIITVLRNLKSASPMLYADSMDHFNDPGSAKTSAVVIPALASHMDRPDLIQPGTGDGQYAFHIDTDGKWWIGLNITGKATGIKDKVAGSARTVGLFAGGAGSPTAGTAYTSSSGWIWISAR